ncbi:SpoIIE family protein phosphatase [Patescibacteria group bacterium]|nr:SpoIIE family protein phosphatase [Patescibacteria group bacterium]
MNTPKSIGSGENILPTILKTPDKLTENNRLIVGEQEETIDPKRIARTFELSHGDYGAICSHKGLRKENQDRGVVIPDASIVAVADGYGDAGTESAQIFCETLIEGGGPVDSIFKKIRGKIWNLIEKYEEGGVCTLTAQIVEYQGQKHLEYTSNGDCRLMVFRKGELYTQSKDQTFSNYLQERGCPQTEDDQKGGKHQSYIINSMNIYTDYEKHHIKACIALKPKDKVILCSDGFIDNSEDKETVEIIKKYEDPFQILEACNNKAIKAMSAFLNWEKQGYTYKPKPDNLTIAVLRIT